MTEEMKLKDMEQISEFLNELEIPAEVMKAGGWFDRGCVLIGLPTEEELDWDESLENLPEDVHIVCGNLRRKEDWDWISTPPSSLTRW